MASMGPRDGGLSPLPEPPDDPTTLDLSLADFYGPWTRVHWCRYKPLYFGRARTHRFDSPAGAFGVLYASEDEYGGFIETLGDIRGLGGHIVLTRKDLEDRCCAILTVERPLQLIDLTGAGLARLGLDSRIFSGEYPIAQRWSQFLHAYDPRPDGIRYRARRDPDRISIALYEHVAERLHVQGRGSLLSQENRMAFLRILDHYGGAFVG
jgi:hypothetical protein